MSSVDAASCAPATNGIGAACCSGFFRHWLLPWPGTETPEQYMRQPWAHRNFHPIAAKQLLEWVDLRDKTAAAAKLPDALEGGWEVEQKCLGDVVYAM